MKTSPLTHQQLLMALEDFDSHPIIQPDAQPGRMDRREFLRTLGVGAAAAGFMGSALARASTLPATGRTGTIEDVEHIVVFMQENRSFDHYFGHLRGVRGYGDRFPLVLPGGKPVWRQPRADNPATDILPFHFDTRKTSAQLLQDLDHSWESQQAAIAGGWMNAWPLNKTDLTMGYFLRDDLPFHYALADAFTLCDHYFASIAGPTCPNRAMLWTGSIDAEGGHGGPFLNDNTCLFDKNVQPFTWVTYPERLQAAGISWYVYQEGLDEIDRNPLTGNFGANALAYFRRYADAPAGSVWRQRALTAGGLRQLKSDVLRNRLPQVSWIVMPAAYSEHPSYPPAFGAIYIARVLDALTANPDVWGRTVLLLDYDENDGFFDHVLPPQPPTPVRPGKSTVSTAGEIHNVVDSSQTPLATPDQLPYGLGPRIPMLAISPWSRGGYVCSQVFDHTSVLQFIEARFGVKEPNITPWRRAICGDLTSAFDFSRQDTSEPSLPGTAGYREMVFHESQLPPPTVPGKSERHVHPQESGIRPARPVPSALDVALYSAADGVHLHFDNHGRTGICCYAFWDGSSHLPQRYTIGAGDTLTDTMAPPPGQVPALSVYGPNGFFRQLAGRMEESPLRIRSRGTDAGDLRLTLSNVGDRTLAVELRDKAYGRPARSLQIPAGGRQDLLWNLQGSHHWYDIEIVAREQRWRMAGHVENGRASFSDPAGPASVVA